MNHPKTLLLTLSLLALLAANAVAQTQTVYFYPPDDGKWIAGRSYISQGTATSAVALTIEPSKCGWYKASISSSSPLRSYAQFWLGKPGTDRIGPNGRWETDFEPGDDFNAVGGVFRLGEIFTRLGNNIYLVADELDPSDPNAGWYGSDPGIEDPSRCKFALAAFIYDTDPSVHPDFSCGIWKKGESCGNGDDTECACREEPKTANLKGSCTGVIRDLVRRDLNPDTRKIEYSGTDPQKCWTSAEWFNKAFRSEPGVNVTHCYNMEFSQIKSGSGVGSFEFDSDKMTNASGRLVGGFFPEILSSAPNDPSCPTCNTKRSADRFMTLHTSVPLATFNEYRSKNNDFKNGDIPTRGTMLGTTSTEAIYEWGDPRKNATWYLHRTSSTSLKNTYGDSDTQFDPEAKANQHFCFESHADFYYDPEQVFYFSGDDPIWVYINNKLVIDLGGAHMAAPDHVKLDTLGLTEGTKYPIDIFFCDQRTVNSNVRITTNMYVVQKSSFRAEPAKGNTTMCAAYSGGSDCASKMGMGSSAEDLCGKALTDKYDVEFYMIRKGSQDTIMLTGANVPKKGECSGTGKDFTCYSGIKVVNGVYSCGGFGVCKNNPEASAKVDIPGNFNVYARVVGLPGGAKPILIDNIKAESNIRIIWGTGVSDDEEKSVTLRDAYGNTTTREQSIIAGKRTPIYIAKTTSWDGNIFVYENDPDFLKNVTYSVSGGNGLTITNSSGEKKNSGILPSTGIDTLWVEGSYSDDRKEYSLNVTSESTDAPSLKITVYPPELKFADSTFAIINNPSGYTRWARAGGLPPYAGMPLKIYIVAWDPERKEICDHCEFPLSKTSTTNNAEINGAWGNSIVQSEATKMPEGGKLSTTIRGMAPVDGNNPNNLAEWTISGPNKDITVAKWTDLKFSDAPIPIPIESYIYDRNGDGIGDKLEIKYSKSFKKDGVLTDLPILLEVIWNKENIVRYHADYNVNDQLKNFGWVENNYNSILDKNRLYWQAYISPDNDSVLVFSDKDFSADIQTSPSTWLVGKESSVSSHLLSYTPYKDKAENDAFQYNNEGLPLTISDRISPIVVKAEYTADKKANCMDNKTPGCYERLSIYLSEPVFMDPDVGDSRDYLVKNPFSYCLVSQQENCNDPPIDDDLRRSQDYDNLNWKWELSSGENEAASATYKLNSKAVNTMTMWSSGVSKGDSIVDMVYYAYKIGTGTTRMPKGSDWVKIRPPVSGVIFRDAAGNIANPRERGVHIEGTNYFRKKQIKIAAIDPKTDPNTSPLDGFEDNLDDDAPQWIKDVISGAKKSEFFKPGNVSEFFPIPKTSTHPDSIRKYFPGSVGTLFEVADNISNEVDKILEDCRVNSKECKTMSGKPLTSSAAEAITIHASAYYHTNLGNYTAHRDPVVVACTDKVFQDESGAGDCYKSRYNFYLAWDLKTNNNRFVGAGAYVAVSRFYWQIDYMEGSKKVSKKFNSDEFVDMFGVRRGSAVK